MKVILLQELKGRGGEGDVIDVARGFAVNYLLPRKIAIEATSGNLKQLELRKHNIEKREAVRLGDASGVQTALDGRTVTIAAKVGEEGRLFGSVTSLMIEAAIQDQVGVTVDHRKIETHGHIKEVGPHTVDVSVYRDVKAQVVVDVVPEGAVAQTKVAEVEGVSAEGTPFVEVVEEAADEVDSAVADEALSEVDEASDAVSEEAADVEEAADQQAAE
jgi:large subunit ribosomal protein L9